MKIEVLAHRPTQSLQPFFPVGIPAGTAQAIEQEPEWIDIDQYIRGGYEHGAYVKVSGLSMKSRQEIGIDDGDILHVHRIGAAETGDVVIAEVNGEFTIKRLRTHAHGLYLVPANEDYPIRRVTRQDQFTIWAVVTHVIHRFGRRAA